MGKVVLVFVAVLLMALLAGCGVGSSRSGMAPDVAQLSSTPFLSSSTFAIPSPGGVLNSPANRSGSALVLERNGSAYEAGFAQLITVESTSARYRPAWAGSASAFSSLAYAIYRFNLQGYTGIQTLQLSWGEAPDDYTNLWVGFSRWDRDCWSWYPGPWSGLIDLGATGFQPYIKPFTGDLLVAVVMIGTTQTLLDKLQVGMEPFISPPGWSLVEIKPGSFIMGSPSGEAGRFDDEVQHKVTLTHGYWLGKYEVTQGQYEELTGMNPSYFPGPNLPVEQVSWDDAQEFMNKLNDREEAAGRLPAGWIYRFPTEAEWEYAARAGTTTAYSFGDDGGALGKYAWYEDNSGEQTHEVGLKDPNPWGLYDMYGNVYEWCADWYEDYPVGDATDPTGPDADTGWGRVFRGGGCYADLRSCRSALRISLGPIARYNSLGFRVVAVQAAGQ
jgi:formylglycine-generating enzyme required for sulfatase activity